MSPRPRIPQLQTADHRDLFTHRGKRLQNGSQRLKLSLCSRSPAAVITTHRNVHKPQSTQPLLGRRCPLLRRQCRHHRVQQRQTQRYTSTTQQRSPRKMFSEHGQHPPVCSATPRRFHTRQEPLPPCPSALPALKCHTLNNRPHKDRKTIILCSSLPHNLPHRCTILRLQAPPQTINQQLLRQCSHKQVGTLQ